MAGYAGGRIPFPVLTAAFTLSLGLVSAAASTINVTTVDDEFNSDGDCSLREAIAAANNDAASDACSPGSGSDTVVVPAGTYVLTIPGPDENTGATGDLDIYSSIDLTGTGTELTVIDGSALDRVLDVSGNVSVTVSDLTVRNGRAPEGGFAGGGIANDFGAALTLNRVAVKDNASTNNEQTRGNGGGIRNGPGGTLTLRECTVSGNIADNGGGMGNSGILDISNSTISNNTARFSGGGISSGGPGSLTVTNSTVSGNRANGVGGGVDFSSIGSGNLDHVTVFGNSSGRTFSSGGLSASGTLAVANSLLADNVPANCESGRLPQSADFNLVSDESCQFGEPSDMNLVAVPLGGLSDNGGPTQTHALLASNPAIDYGPDTDCPATDQRGFARPADGDGDTTATCDVGAFEVQAGFQVAATAIAASILPGSRSVLGSATVFASIVNGGTTEAVSCAIAPRRNIPPDELVEPARFSYQTTDPLTNGLTGTPDTPANIPPGGSQTFLLSIETLQAFAPEDVAFRFQCANTLMAPVVTGVNTLLLSAPATPAPDVVALAGTTSGDGIVSIQGTGGNGAFAVASVNVGSPGTLSISADTGDMQLPVTVGICETDPSSGACTNPASPTTGSVTTAINTGATPTFAVFATAMGSIPLDAANNRIFVRFRDQTGVTRGATSVAVRSE